MIVPKYQTLIKKLGDLSQLILLMKAVFFSFFPLGHSLRCRLLYVCILPKGGGTDHTITPHFLKELV